MRLRLLGPLLLLAALPLPALAQPAPGARTDATLLTAQGPVTAFVHGTSTAAARRAAARSGLQVVESYDRVGIVVATGLPAAVRRAAHQPGVTFLEDAGTPMTFDLDRAHRATRNADAQALIRPGLSGRGVSVAVIDTGIDGTHPFFRLEGASKVVANLKNVCTDVLTPTAPSACWVPVLSNDSDSASAGGHGTHVAGIVAGYPTKAKHRLTGATRTLSGAAPGAHLVGLSVGNGLSINGGTSGMNWVLEHHRTPCGAAVSVTRCPPIRVVNNSWGSLGGSAFDPASARVKLQRALVADGVVVVWAAGNDAGDGSGKDDTGAQKQTTNGPGNDPTPGVLMVAAYDDGGTGTSDGSLASYSSRGVRGKPDTYPDLSAPGSNILSSCRPYLAVCSSADPWDAGVDAGAFNSISGTSMAAPFVSGVVAELLALDPSLTPAGVERVLETGAHRYGGGGYEPDPLNPGSPTSFDRGHGLVDVLASADLVQRRTPRPQLKAACGVQAWTDEAGDANGVYHFANAGESHPVADLRAGRWEWDGTTLTAVFFLTDISPDARKAGETGTYANWRVRLGDSSTVFSLVAKYTSYTSFYMYSSDTTALTRGLQGRVVDRDEDGADELRVSLTNDDLAAFAPAGPRLGRGQVLTTLDLTGAYHTTEANSVSTDRAVGGCPITLR